MSYISQRNVKGKKYYYLEESFFFNKKLIKESVYFGSMYPSNDEIFLGIQVLNRTCLARNHTVLTPPLTEFIKNKTAKILEFAKNIYLKKYETLSKKQLQKLKEQKLQALINFSSNTRTDLIEKKNLKKLLNYYEEGLLKNELLTETKIRKMHSLLTNSSEIKSEEYNSNLLHLFFTWHKEKNDLIHQVEFASKFCSKFFNLKLFKEHNLILTYILMNYILEQKKFPFVPIQKKRIEKYKKTLNEGEKENFKPITTFLIKEINKFNKK